MPTPQKQPPTKRSQTPAPQDTENPARCRLPRKQKRLNTETIHPTRRGNLYKKHLQEKKNKSMKITNKNKETHSHPHETTRRNNSESPPTIPPTPPTKQPTQKTPTSKTNQQGQPIKTNNGTPTIPHHTQKRPPPKQAEGAPPKNYSQK